MSSRHVAHFWASPDLRVIAIFGDADLDDARALVRVMRDDLAKRRRFSSLVDVRRLGRIDEEPLSHFLAFAREAKQELARAVVRSAVVHGEGLSGSIALGYTRLLGEPFPVRAFADVPTAMEWLEHAELAGTVEERLTSSMPLADDLAKLRAHLARSLSGKPTLASAAKALGVSSRELQRRLESEGTSLRAELARARVSVAKDRLVRTDDKLLAIAIDLGFSKSEPLSRAFRAETGTTPLAFREAHRKKTGG